MRFESVISGVLRVMSLCYFTLACDTVMSLYTERQESGVKMQVAAVLNASNFRISQLV